YPSLRVVNLCGKRFVADSETEAALRAAVKTAERTCSRWTVMSVVDLEARCRSQGTALDQEVLRHIVETIANFGCLDATHTWFWIRSARSRLLNQVQKILAVSPRISLAELRAGVARHHRMDGFAPPRHVLAALCCEVGGCRVVGDQVAADPGL